MKRYHDELSRTRRVYAAHQRRAHNHSGALFPCTCDRQVGYFRKHRAFGCERRHCSVCRVGKSRGVPTPRERRQRESADAAIREWREEAAGQQRRDSSGGGGYCVRTAFRPKRV